MSEPLCGCDRIAISIYRQRCLIAGSTDLAPFVEPVQRRELPISFAYFHTIKVIDIRRVKLPFKIEVQTLIFVIEIIDR